jgi:hypothetical protein
MNALVAVVHEHRESVLVLRIFFSILLAIVFLSGLYIFSIRKRLFDRDPNVAADHYGARNLRLWQVILVWLLAMDLLITALFYL